MSEWREVRLGDVCHIKHGYAFKGEYFVSNKLPYVITTPANFRIGGGFKMADNPKFYNGEIPENYILKAGDLIVTMTDLSKRGDTLGFAALIPKDKEFIYLHNQRIGLVENIRENVIDKTYLYWIMRTYHYQRFVVGCCSGTTVKHTSPDRICEYVAKIPSLPEQKAIASILSSLDEKISINKKICENLESQAQALFKNWFIDFAPFKNGRFVESELGMIPEGWRVGKAQDLYEINIGKTPPRAERQWFSENKEPNKIWVSISDMGSCGMYISDSKEYITPEAQSKFNIVMVPVGSILLSFKLTIGRVAIAEKELTTNEAIARFIMPEQYYKEYTYLYLKQYKYGSLGSTSSIATAVNSKIIKSMPILLPRKQVMKEFSNITSALFDKIRIAQQESANLSALRDALLPNLMSGAIKV